MKPKIYFLTGSCGSGKTTLLKKMGTFFPNMPTYQFDTVPMPSLQEMVAQFGDPAGWQQHTAQEWMKKAVRSGAPLTLIDGQVRPTALLAVAKVVDVMLHITLVDCAHDERRHRLLNVRRQPHLDQLDTYAWASYLRGQADALQLEVIDTTNASLDESTQLLAQSIQKFASS